MSARRYFSYVRVSTARQGQTNTSLGEQLAAIERYAAKWNLTIIKRYEEQETAAKQGRPIFLEMLKALRDGKADGLVIHKVDRGARNLKDWADLGSLIDTGIEVLFANESIDLQSRGGRLSADIQAVVAADFIRNLREEVKKGFYGRLKQGLYPMPAPVGYKDCGAGKPKELHPLYAPLVRQAFELYATGKYSLRALTLKMSDAGLRNRSGNALGKNAVNVILKNRFYTGLIEIEKTGEIFAGRHEPLVSQAVFEQVQAVFTGKKADKKNRHFFVFRKLIECRSCSRKLIPERQKGWAYYRCQTKDCPQKTIREETIESEMRPVLQRLQFTTEENRHLAAALIAEEKNAESLTKTIAQTLELQLEQCRHRLSKLTDAFVDGTIERELFVPKKNSLVIEEQGLLQKLASLNAANTDAVKKTREILENANRAHSSYKLGLPEEKREMVKIIASNAAAHEKTVLFKLNYPFELVANRNNGTIGEARRDVDRVLADLVKKLIEYFLDDKNKRPVQSGLLNSIFGSD